MSINAILQATNAGVTGQPEPVVGMGATLYVGSDRYPYFISKVISPKEIEVKRANFRRTDKNGFSESQTYEITPNEAASPETFTQRKNGRWIAKGTGLRSGSTLLIGRADAYQDPSF